MNRINPAVPVLVVILAITLITGCRSENLVRMKHQTLTTAEGKEVSLGMSTEQVLEILGPPTRKISYEPDSFRGLDSIPGVDYVINPKGKVSWLYYDNNDVKSGNLWSIDFIKGSVVEIERIERK